MAFGKVAVCEANRLKFKGNWKLAYDNSGDGYHVVFSHRSLLEMENRLKQLMETFDRDRPLMLCIEAGGTVRGGVVAVGVDSVGVRAIGVDQATNSASA